MSAKLCSRVCRRVALLALLGACAPTVTWGKAGTNDSQMRVDLAACRRAADHDVAPSYDRRFDADFDRDTGLGGGRGDPLASADRQNAARELNHQIATCMAGQGYVKSQPKAEAKK